MKPPHLSTHCYMMKKIIYILILTVSLCNCSNVNCSEQISLQFDGVYRALGSTTEYGPSYYYLRFYPDGKVVSGSLIGTPEQFWASTSQNYKYKSTGQYHIKNGEIIFTTRSKDPVLDVVEVNYWGKKVSNEDLTFKKHSLATGQKSELNYKFYKIDQKNESPTLYLFKKRNDGNLDKIKVPNNSDSN